MSRLSRWSRRKLGEDSADNEEVAAPPVDAEMPDPGPDDIETPSAEDTAPPDPEPGSLDHTLPDPDTLPAGSDIKAFMAPGVSAGLRKRALRRLFAAERYGIRDGLNDYDHDYRQCLKPLTSEVAQRLRKWADRFDETETTETEPETVETKPGMEANDREATTASLDSDDEDHAGDAIEPASKAIADAKSRITSRD
ncbi:DUF3306 domain-containing protein [Litchfieldella rifensis]|uniref:DUF3306 domain-containing protein n=1 Tax=Litchfieldella rifensis TaxID=762643 RepID=A0ABV7LS29_9GAMM